MVDPRDEELLRNILLESGMCGILEESLIERRPDGRLLLAGFFAVFHKLLSDRLICDKRPANWGEKRLAWASLPLSSQLAHLLLLPHQHIRASGDDLSSYFYQLEEAPEMLSRCAVGRKVPGDQVVKWGGGARSKL